MAGKYNIIPLNLSPKYIPADVSVIIPTSKNYQRRNEWFLEQYMKSTPPEVVNQTYLVTDPDDEESKKLCEKHNIHLLYQTEYPAWDWSTYKMMRGFEEVKTRLCIRIHNDMFIARTDWVDQLVDRFNEVNEPQLVGFCHKSGTIVKEAVDQYLRYFPMFQPIYDQLEFKGEPLATGLPFIAGSFIAGQSYIFKSLYPLVLQMNEGKMDKEDGFTTITASLFKIKVVSWLNQGEFVKDMGKYYGDFKEDYVPPTAPEHIITEENKDQYPKAQFKEVVI